MSKKTMDPALRKQKLVELSFYRDNARAYNCILFAILVELLYVITVLGNMEVTYLMGVVTMLNIAIIFILFTIAVKVKVYDEKWTGIGFAMAAYLGLRLLVLLPMLVKPTGAYTIVYGSSVLSLALVLWGALDSQKKISQRTKLQREKGEA